MEFEKLDDDIKEYIRKQSELMCDYRMQEFFTAIGNTIKIKESLFSTDPIHYQTLSELKESHRIILDRYNKEKNMSLPYDDILYENRRRYDDKISEKFDELYLHFLHGRIDSRMIFAIKKFISNSVNDAFSVDKRIIKF